MLAASLIFATACVSTNVQTSSADVEVELETSATKAEIVATTKKPTTTIKKTTGTTGKESLRIEEGQYKVGVDIPESLYLIFPYGDSGYFELTSDGNNIIVNENFSGPCYIRAEKGEYLKLSRAYAQDGYEWSPKINSIVGTNNGMFFVGGDIPEGEYKLRAVGSRGNGYYANLDSRHEIYENDFFSGTAYVTVRKGTFLLLSNAEIISAP